MTMVPGRTLAAFVAVMTLMALQCLAMVRDTSDSNEKLMRQMVSSWNDRDLEATMAHFADDAVVRMNCIHGECKAQGILEISQLCSEDLNAFTDTSTKIDKMICDDSSCMILQRTSGTHSSLWHSLQPFGARIENMAVMIWTRIDKGKVAEMAVVHDVHGVKEVLTPKTRAQKLMRMAWKISEVWNGVRQMKDLRDAISDDFQGTCPLYKDQMLGKEEIIADIRRWKIAFPDMTMTFKLSPGSRSNEVINQWHMRGTFMNKYGEVKPTNSVVEFDGVSVITFNENGKVSVDRTVFDSDDVLRQMGATPDMMTQTMRSEL